MDTPRHWSRRDFSRTLAVAGIGAGALPLLPKRTAMLTRAIPASGELLPVVGIGTWQTFDVGSSAQERDPLREVLRLFVERGGSVVDSSPMYGRSETVVGDLAAELGIQERLFYATKVWTAGRSDGVAQMDQSFARFRVDQMDLMQIHNLVGWPHHMETIRELKEEGRVRYAGVTHYQVGAHSRLEELVRDEDLDFVQFNYSIATRAAEQRLLPAAADHGTAVIINRPYEGGSLFRKVRGQELPEWAAEFDCTSWGQFFLKYIISQPAVTCVIPGTGNPEHLVDNTGAGMGRLPDPATRRRMVEYLDAL